MWPKRFILLPALVLLFFLGMYSWNQNTGLLDNLAENSGLEVVGVVLRSTDLVRNTVLGTWSRYLDLVNVRQENDSLRRQLLDVQNRLILAAEERAELKRLRDLLSLDPPEKWPTMGARVIGGRMGSNAVLGTITLGCGYLSGATPATPAVTEEGLVGRVFRSGPVTSTVLLITDPSSRVAVIGQTSRSQGVLVGGGTDKPLEVRFVAHNTPVQLNEILVTSGLDEIFPKGIPVAVVTGVAPSDVSPFPAIMAAPLVDFSRLEEVVLLERPENVTQQTTEIPVDLFVGPPLPQTNPQSEPRTDRRAQP